MEKITYNFKNRTAVVTGGAQGFGLDIAKRFLKSEAKVIIWDLDSKAIEKASNEIDNPNLSSKIVDVSNFKDVENATKEITKTSNIDILINNAGITRDNLFMRMSDEDWDVVMEVNLTSTMKLCRGVLRGMMKSRWGRIVNIGSVVGSTGNPGQGNYAASKAALLGMSKSLASEVASRGITVNCIAPGFVKTAMTDKLNDKQQEAIKSQIPAGRMGDVSDIAFATLYLSSEESSYVTGSTLHVNGGMAMF